MGGHLCRNLHKRAATTLETEGKIVIHAHLKALAMAAPKDLETIRMTGQLAPMLQLEKPRSHLDRGVHKHATETTKKDKPEAARRVKTTERQKVTFSKLDNAESAKESAREGLGKIRKRRKKVSQQ